VLEMVAAAAKKKLWAVGITDHGRTTPNSPGDWYFENLWVIPKIIDGVYVLKGMEANIWDYDGNLDASNLVFSRLNWIVASMHPETLKPIHDVDACTNAWLNVAKNPFVNVIGHSGEERYKYDYEKVIPEFASNGKLVEINNGSFRVRKGSIENCKKIALICKKHGAYVIVNSDSHFSTQVGNVNLALEMLKEIDFPDELIINGYKNKFEDYLKNHTNFFS
jgi:putative hydrolase